MIVHIVTTALQDPYLGRRPDALRFLEYFDDLQIDFPQQDIPCSHVEHPYHCGAVAVRETEGTKVSLCMNGRIKSYRALRIQYECSCHKSCVRVGGGKRHGSSALAWRYEATF